MKNDIEVDSTDYNVSAVFLPVVEKADPCEDLWVTEWDEDLVFYHQNMPHWNSTNEAVKMAIEGDTSVPPVTFVAHTVLNYMRQEVRYELQRMRKRGTVETEGAAQYFRSTYPKYICWMNLVDATLRKEVVSPTKVAFEYKLSEQGVRSIFEEALKADWALTMLCDGKKHYCASNITMSAYFDRLKREAQFFDTQKIRALSTFKSLIEYIPKRGVSKAIDWFQKAK